MQKTKLNKFIQKYNLGGNVNSVKWKSDNQSLSTSFVTPDKSLLGTVEVNNFQFEDADLGVYQTDQLQKLLSVLDNDVNLTLVKAGDKAVSLKVKNVDHSRLLVLTGILLCEELDKVLKKDSKIDNPYSKNYKLKVKEIAEKHQDKMHLIKNNIDSLIDRIQSLTK